MKLKLETNLFATRYSKEGVFTKEIDQAKIKISQSLLTPHLKMILSTQVPIEKRENSKGFLKVKQVNHPIGKHCLFFLDLTEKNLDLSGKKKASLRYTYSLFSQESFLMIYAFPHLVHRGSSLSSSKHIKTD